ncbi:hypothetical protein [Micromonospora polyrhachis]|uniref:Uncharacterized protein n=1 Tax=Micromonospora polyrhachis TaxID=1282883 RepID=A0A7W7SSJ4_9ACTN|nr:hypothetical protein [Micromonospora polyrhachis]MBB4958920.1 hypothetical protein [Micromonospora polyrhachis]
MALQPPGGDPVTAPAYTGRHRPANTNPTTGGRRLIPTADRVPAGWTPLADDVRAGLAPTHTATATTTVMPALEATR